MTIAVLGATGKIGRLVVERLIDKGYEVRVLVRDVVKVEQILNQVQNDNLTHVEIVEGDAVDEVAIRTLVDKADAVVSCLGHVKTGDPLLQTKVMKLLVKTLKPGTRVVSVTGTGVHGDGDTVSPVVNVLDWGVSVVDPERVNDGRRHVEVLRGSELRWTVVRTPVHVSGSGKYQVADLNWRTGWWVWREAVAEVIVECVSEGKYVREMPVVSVKF